MRTHTQSPHRDHFIIAAEPSKGHQRGYQNGHGRGEGHHPRRIQCKELQNGQNRDAFAQDHIHHLQQQVQYKQEDDDHKTEQKGNRVFAQHVCREDHR